MQAGAKKLRNDHVNLNTSIADVNVFATGKSREAATPPITPTRNNSTLSCGYDCEAAAEELVLLEFVLLWPLPLGEADF